MEGGSHVVLVTGDMIAPLLDVG